MPTMAFIGLGVMGLPMARRLVAAGYRVVGHDRAEAAREAARAGGIEIAADAAEAGREATIAITMLPTGDDVREALFGAGGLLESFAPGGLVIDMSTVQPLETDELASRLEAGGWRFLDAPVGRSSQHAEEGRLLIMVGGTAADLERARPVLAVLGDTIVHCGPAGSGARAKIVNNYLSIVSNVVTAEALVLADRCGLDREAALEVMRGTPAGRGHLGTTYPAKVLAGDVTPGFAVDLAHKDLWLALELAARLRCPLATGVAAEAAYDLARARGRGREDWTTVLNVLAEAHDAGARRR